MPGLSRLSIVLTLSALYGSKLRQRAFLMGLTLRLGSLVTFQVTRALHSLLTRITPTPRLLPVSRKEGSRFDEETVCAICLWEEERCEYVLPACQHRFHESCLEEWCRRNSFCPVCKTEVQVGERLVDDLFLFSRERWQRHHQAFLGVHWWERPVVGGGPP